MDCWDAHLPVARHREAWAEEQTAPSSAEAAQGATKASEPSERTTTGTSAAAPSSTSAAPVRRRVEVKPQRDPNLPVDVLIVASKLKAYIRAASDMNTSGNVMDVLSDKVRDLCDAAIAKARAAGRQTVMDRDFR